MPTPAPTAHAPTPQAGGGASSSGCGASCCRPAPLGLVLSREVAEALAAGRPVVALESTIISHGALARARARLCCMLIIASFHSCMRPAGARLEVAAAKLHPCRFHLNLQRRLQATLAATSRPRHSLAHAKSSPFPPHAAAPGMPYPQNLETALQVEEVVRAGGAVPATVAIIAGECCVGE